MTNIKNSEGIVNALKIIWDYMRLNQKLEKGDLIIGCGCSDMQVPIRCAELYKEGYAPKILFAGGIGKITKYYLNKSEAEIYKDIAIREGVPSEDIYIESESTNTGDNFRFGMKILEENNIKADRILIVHNTLSERRTLSSAKAILKNKDLIITSPNLTFEEYLDYLEVIKEQVIDKISVLVGDIQRIIIYPQFGWQVENEVPDSVLSAYEFLKYSGFDKYILEEKEIDILIQKYGIIDGKVKCYFK